MKNKISTKHLMITLLSIRLKNNSEHVENIEARCRF